MSGRKVWQAKALTEHPELRVVSEREQLARAEPAESNDPSLPPRRSDPYDPRDHY